MARASTLKLSAHLKEPYLFLRLVLQCFNTSTAFISAFSQAHKEPYLSMAGASINHSTLQLPSYPCSPYFYDWVFSAAVKVTIKQLQVWCGRGNKTDVFCNDNECVLGNILPVTIMPPQIWPSPDHRPLWLWVGTPSDFGSELAYSWTEHNPLKGMSIDIEGSPSKIQEPYSNHFVRISVCLQYVTRKLKYFST